MIFGTVATDMAEGAILAHSVALPGGRLRKGAMLDAAQIEALHQAGVSQVTVARLEADDLHEDVAATQLAAALATGAEAVSLSAAFTGRVNLIADEPGVVQLDAARITAANAVHPMITIATVQDLQQMAAGQMIATVKIISYGVPAAAVASACAAMLGGVRMAVPVLHDAALIITDTQGGPGEKGRAAMAGRLDALGVTLAQTTVIPHDEDALTAALQKTQAGLIMILTASATSDPNDTGPAALRRAGGRVERFGMPVDPGNLLFVGQLDGTPVIGLPGCARSPALNGADWVLSRTVCGIAVTDADIAGMGVGGLLKEIPTRPMPRRGRR